MTWNGAAARVTKAASSILFAFALLLAAPFDVATAQVPAPAAPAPGQAPGPEPEDAVAAPAPEAKPAAAAKSGTIVTLGGFGAFAPRFEGARRSEWGFIPLFDIRDASSKEWLNFPRDGIDLALVETSTLRAGLVGNFRWNRDTSSLVRGFRRVGNIDLSLEGGVFAELWPAQWLRTRVELREAVMGARGFIADLSADLVTHPLPALTWTAGPRLSLADRSFMAAYYGIDATQAARSGLPEYNAGAGLRSYGAGTMLRFKASETVSTFAFVEYQRMADGAFDSPLITRRGSPNQTTIGVGSSISFSIGD
jgi:outer membrane protein